MENKSSERTIIPRILKLVKLVTVYSYPENVSFIFRIKLLPFSNTAQSYELLKKSGLSPVTLMNWENVYQIYQNYGRQQRNQDVEIISCCYLGEEVAGVNYSNLQ